MAKVITETEKQTEKQKYLTIAELLKNGYYHDNPYISKEEYQIIKENQINDKYLNRCYREDPYISMEEYRKMVQEQKDRKLFEAVYGTVRTPIEKIEEYLVDGANPNFKPNYNTTFGVAVKEHKMDVLKLLGLYGASVLVLNSDQSKIFHNMLDNDVELAACFPFIA